MKDEFKVKITELLRRKPGRPFKNGPMPLARKLYMTIKCMSCDYKYRTPIYRTHGAYSEGFSKDPRKESDVCERCGARTPM